MRVRGDRRMRRQEEVLCSIILFWLMFYGQDKDTTSQCNVLYALFYFLMVCPGAQTNLLLVLIYRFKFFPHTVELCYQNSLLQTSEELVVVVVGPLTLNAGLLLMVLIRWVCQQRFDSFPSFLSKFIIALGLWTVLDPLAVFIVDSFLGVSHLK